MEEFLNTAFGFPVLLFSVALVVAAAFGSWCCALRRSAAASTPTWTRRR